MTKNKGKGKPTSDPYRKGQGQSDAAAEDEYTLPVPDFDERAFLKKEIDGARTTFVTVFLGIAVGLLARGSDWVGITYMGASGYMLGWIVIAIGMAGLAPLLRLVGFSEELTEPRQMAGNWFLLFFTSLAIWVFSHNI